MKWSAVALLLAILLCASAAAPAMAEAPNAPLKGRIIAVDAGHGLPDGGCVGRTTKVQEQAINLDIARRVAFLLEAAGAQVILVRKDDYALHPRDMPLGNRKKTDFAERKKLVTQGNADIVLSIHMNEYPSSSSRGAQVFHQQDGDNAQGKRLAGCIQDALNAAQPTHTRSIAKGDFFMLRIGPPGVLIECGFLSNPEEERLLQTDAHRQTIAASITEGVSAFFLD